MKIYTRKGDEGFSVLGKNQKIDKAHPAIAFMGEMDELQMRIGSIGAWHHSGSEKVSNKPYLENELAFLRECIYQIYEINSSVFYFLTHRENKTAKEITENTFVYKIEERIDHIEKMLPPLTDFIYCDQSFLGNLVHLARTQTRKAERSAGFLKDTKIQYHHVFQFLNRLSDYFFTLARWIETDFEKKDQTIR